MLSGDAIIVVSGLPRSGTSMMMRMLHAGGVPLLTDADRIADPDNPRGYFEYAPVKRLRDDASWVSEARGKAVKVVSILLQALPAYFPYNIVFMERDLEEVLASQRAMLLRRYQNGEIGPEAVDEHRLDEDDLRLREMYARHLPQIQHWIRRQKNMRLLIVNHNTTLTDASRIAHEITSFLNQSLDKAAMTAAVDPALYRQRLLPN